MKKISSRAISVLLIAALVIGGLAVYIQRYIDHGKDWALYFSQMNSGSTGELFDCNGISLAKFSSYERRYAEDELIRRANYHVTGDYWGRTGSGVLSNFWNDMQDFSLITGTTQVEHSAMTLNIDANINRFAFEALGEQKGAFMICNYQTGELLCLVSTPAIDPAEDEPEPLDGAYINRCLSASFIPGSVFKLITAAAAIENISDLYQRSFYCEGVYTIAGVDISCAGVHYTQTFEQAMANSCNCAFAQIAVMTGHETMIKYVREYGFLSPHSLDGIPTAAGSYPLEFIGDPELAWSGIGQSTDLISPYALLRYVSAIANGGILCEPQLIKDGAEPEKSRMINADTAQKLRQLMSYNVAYHYEGGTNFPGLDICAKTGTAELGDGTTHAWFAGFLNDSEHPYAFVSFVEQGGGGLSVAGKLANTVLQEAVK